MTTIRNRWHQLGRVYQAIVVLFLLIVAGLAAHGGLAYAALLLLLILVAIECNFWQRHAILCRPVTDLGYAVSQAIYKAIDDGADRVEVHITHNGTEWEVRL